MEIGLREWLIVGAIIVIVLIVVDGWRRMRAQSNSLKIDIDEKLSDLGDETYNPELPHGTARVFKPKDKGDVAPAESLNPADSANANNSGDQVDHNIGFNAQSTDKDVPPVLEGHQQQAQTEKSNPVEPTALKVNEEESLERHQPDVAVDHLTQVAQTQASDPDPLLSSHTVAAASENAIKPEMTESVEQESHIEAEPQETPQRVAAESVNNTFSTNSANLEQSIEQTQEREDFGIDGFVTGKSVVERPVTESPIIESSVIENSVDSSAIENSVIAPSNEESETKGSEIERSEVDISQRIPQGSENIYNTDIGFSALSDVPNATPVVASEIASSANDEIEESTSAFQPAVNTEQHIEEPDQINASIAPGITPDITSENDFIENTSELSNELDKNVLENDGVELETEVFHKNELEEPTTIINDMLSALSDSDQMRDITPIIKEESTVELQNELDAFSQQDSYLDSLDTFQGTAVDDKFEQLLAERQTDGYIIAPADDMSNIDDATVIDEDSTPTMREHAQSHSHDVDGNTGSMEPVEDSQENLPNSPESKVSGYTENSQDNVDDAVESAFEQTADQATSSVDPRELVLSSMQNEGLTAAAIDTQDMDDQRADTEKAVPLTAAEQATGNDEHFDVQTGVVEPEDSQSSITASVEDEILQLKARLKELSPELVVDQDNVVAARSSAEQYVENLGEADHQESDSLSRLNQSTAPSPLDLPAFLVRDEGVDASQSEQPILVDASKYSTANEDLAQNNEEPEVLDQRMKDQMTTVIDDDVELADLRAEVTKVPSDFELAVAEAAAEPENIEENATLGHDLPPFNELSDPLLDDLDESLDDSLLAEDAGHPSDEFHELNRPITELIKQNQTRPSNPQQFDIEHDLLESYAQIEEAVEHENQNSSLQQESLAFDADSVQEEAKGDRESARSVTRDYQNEALNDSVQEPSPAKDSNDMLGFTALEQGYIEDPLMDGLLDEAQESVKTTHEERHHSPASAVIDTTEASEDDNSVLNVEMERASAVRKSIAGVKDPQSVLIVTVVAKDQPLDGDSLKHVVVACGMQFGEMNIFHRFEDGPNQGAVQFSMANAVNPGSFDIEQMGTSVTPGVSFFMSMDTPKDPKNALECMMGTAETVAKHLNGDLLDDNRSVIRPQTKEHYRERVREHEMDKLRRRAQ